ncbi:ornithine cyclodeaminase [Legionella geestiana]|uniref:Ornithine cyclodeaminase n=1 Tax=Legionella geestiana TaxID=45065 RepID=A0A0W0TNP0_9GAMM|nr:ornithine cyclodeaminase family protein [Legionella geestiana]KTC97218.1 ornithine cyclodeaminase [Legionella geestiana]QBS12352.1 ornithine cyclodeaminase family protein [Legionella geestiana]STX55211.1 ornithine cyclodeaminase [Legionella geestiana]
MALKLLSISEVKQNITMAEAIDAMESAFVQLAEHQATLPMRTGIPVGNNGLALTMPAYLSKENILGLKTVSVFPDNVKHGKPSINGTILLLDAATGEPLTLMDAGYLTALRTGAVSGLATKYFSLDKPSTVAIVGAGAQAVTQLEAVAAVREIQKVMVWSRHLESAKKFAKKMENTCNIHVCEALSPALKAADIICTATAGTEPLVHLEGLKPHVHINAVGSHTPLMQEISGEVLKNAVVIVDQLEAAMHEAGEIIEAVKQQNITKASIIELGSWLLKKAPPIQEKRTVFKSVGLAIQDLAVAHVVYQNTLKRHAGSVFKLD